ncbi:phenylalanine--tRNA ligase subunit alpha [Candidatus Peregrinibacteria bacterium]|nr:phenylalanine--tRNA ligase subunit alpha [Candidatus Peregrinibacteria bacterium]
MPEKLLKQALEAIQAASTITALKEVEVKYLGRSGQITELLKTLKDLSPEEKRSKGQEIQKLKNGFTEAYTTRERYLQKAEIDAKLQAEFFDITLNQINPQRSLESGTIHPLSRLQREVEQIFAEMGFEIADGKEVESEYYNFEALNIPSHHPARDMQDTFFLDHPTDTKHGHLLLRTHTSPGQIRMMEKHGAPLRIIIPGRVFRYEATDATHDSTFNQVEGLFIDQGIGLAHLKGIMNEFLQRFFGDKEIKVRFRPGYFPFVEPGIEMDMLWKKGNQSKWLEVMGAGMVHPNVLKAGGLDPEKYQGWAFGFGLTRMAMLKYGIDDIRLIHSNDLRFLNQF